MKALNNAQVLAIICAVGIVVSATIFYNKSRNIERLVDENKLLMQKLFTQGTILKNTEENKTEHNPNNGSHEKDTETLKPGQNSPSTNEQTIFECPCNEERQQNNVLQDLLNKTQSTLAVVNNEKSNLVIELKYLNDSLRIARMKLIVMENNFRTLMDNNLLQTDKEYLFTYPSLILADEDFTQKYKKLYQMRKKVIDSALFALPYLKKSIKNQNNKLIIEPRVVKALQRLQKRN